MTISKEKISEMNSPFGDNPTGHHEHSQQNNGKKALAVQMIFLLFAFSLVVFFRSRPQFHTLGIIFVSIVLEAFPFMLLGTLIGGFIEVFVSREKITRWLPEGRWWTVFVGAGIGVIFPVCECAIDPTPAGLGSSCSGSIHMGTLRDRDGDRVTVTGKAAPAGREIWFSFQGEDDSDTSGDEYHVDVRFLENPGNAYVMDVYRVSPTLFGSTARQAKM